MTKEQLAIRHTGRQDQKCRLSEKVIVSHPPCLDLIVSEDVRTHDDTILLA